MFSNVSPNKPFSIITAPTTKAAAIAKNTIELVKANMNANKFAALMEPLFT